VSIAFPLIVYALHFRCARKDNYLNMSWLVFGVSCVWSYFFYEDGQRIGHGNFVWTAYIALFVLMFSSILFLIKHYSKRPQPEGAPRSVEMRLERSAEETEMVTSA